MQGVIGPAVEAAQTQPDADSAAQTAPRALFEEMVTAMQNDTIAHRFSNIESLANNLRLRAHVVLAMQRMSIGVLDADYFEVSRGIPANLGTCHNYHHLMQIIDDGNDASVRVAKALGATLDPDITRRENAEGGAFCGNSVPVQIFLLHQGAWS